MFIVALFIISKIWKQPKCPLMDERIKKIWYTHTHHTHTGLLFGHKKEGNLAIATMWMDLEDIRLSKIKSEKDTV